MLDPSAVPETVWQALIAAIVTIVLAWMQRGTRKAVDNATSAASDAAQQATKVAQQTHMMQAGTRRAVDSAASVASDAVLKATSIAEETHMLVNSAMGAQLRLNADMARRLAHVTGEAEDVQKAELAEKLFNEHMDKQAEVDAKARKE